MAGLTQTINGMHVASFREFPFFVLLETETTGQKVAIHEYPNSNKQYIEPLGTIPSKFNLSCTINGENLLQKRIILRQKLNAGGVGDLIHPIYGKLQVQVGGYTVKSLQRNTGEFNFDVTFYTSEISIFPKKLPDTGNSALNKSKIIQEFALGFIESNYERPSNKFELASSVDAISELLDNIQVSSDNTVSKIEADLNDTKLSAVESPEIQDSIDIELSDLKAASAKIRGTISRFKGRVSSIMQTAKGYKDELQNIYNDVSNLSLIPGQLFDFWDDLMVFNFLPSSDVGLINTTSRSKNTNNKNLTRDVNRLIGLSGSYGAKPNIEYSNTDELNISIKKTDNSFDLFFSGGNILSSDINVRKLLLNLRNSAKTAIDAQRANIWKIIEVEIDYLTSVTLFSYKYYGNLDNIELLCRLNPSLPRSNFTGKIKAIAK